MTYRPDIDGLRALAIIMVLGFHAMPGLMPSGFLGVDVFFVISGYLITGLLLRENGGKGFSIKRFYIRRVKRLFPAMLTVLAFSLFAGILLLFPFEFRSLAKHVISSLFFFQNFQLAMESGYFDTEAISKPLLHMWSLSVEEQFYLIWPVALIFLTKLPPNLAKLTILLLSLLSFLAAVLIPISDAWRFYLSPLRFWEIFAGAFLAFGLHDQKTSPKFAGIYNVVAQGATVAALAVLIVLPFWDSVDFLHPGPIALLSVVATIYLIWIGREGLVNRWLLSMPPLVFLGLISYPLYLWHWPIISFATIWNGEFPEREVRVALVLLAVLLAWLTYRFVENPLRFRWPADRAFKALVGSALLLVLAVPILAVIHGDGRDGKAEAIQAQLTGALWDYTENDICKARYPEGYRYFCIQNEPGKPDIMLLGNSYANHFYPGFVNHPRTREMTILSYGACEPSGLWDDQNADCQRQDELLAGAEVPRYVFVSAIWPRFDSQDKYLPLPSEAMDKFAASITPANYQAALEKRLGDLSVKGIKIVIFGPKLELGYDIVGCFARPLRPPRHTCRIPARDAMKATNRTVEILRQVAENVPGVTYFDQRGLFCDTQTCNVIASNGLPMLRDRGHYSEKGSLMAADSFHKWAVDNLPGWRRKRPVQPDKDTK